MSKMWRTAPTMTKAHSFLQGTGDDFENHHEWIENINLRYKRVNTNCEVPADFSDILKPGVYLLGLHGRVVFVGRSHCMLMSIAAHRTAAKGPRLPEWFPIKGIIFDSLPLIATSYDRTLTLSQALIDFHKPTHNVHSTQIRKADKEGPPPPDSQPLVRRL